MASLIGGSIRCAIRSRAAPSLRTGARLPIRRGVASSASTGGGGSLYWIVGAGVAVAGLTAFSVSLILLMVQCVFVSPLFSSKLV